MILGYLFSGNRTYKETLVEGMSRSTTALVVAKGHSLFRAPSPLITLETTTSAAVADSILGAMGIEETPERELLRFAVGATIISMTTHSKLEGLLFYSAYRVLHTCLSLIHLDQLSTALDELSDTAIGK
jgi:hypothetical protein